MQQNIRNTLFSIRTKFAQTAGSPAILFSERDKTRIVLRFFNFRNITHRDINIV